MATPIVFPEKVVAIRPTGGLASRIKCIASFGVIAKWFRTPLHVYWSESPGFEETSFATLFAKHPEPIVFLDSDDWNRLRTNTPRVLHLEKSIPYLNSTYTPPMYKLETLLNARKPYKWTAECNRELFAVYSHVLSCVIPNFTETYNNFLDSFRPHSAVCDIVRSEVRAWNSIVSEPKVLGVHMRRGDALQSPMGHRFLKFTDLMFNETIQKHLGKSADSVVFVSTDEWSVHKQICAQYHGEPRVRCLPWKRFTHVHGLPKGGQRKALVDLWTLRCCGAVKGTSFSVFMQLGARPLPLFEREQLCDTGEHPGISGQEQAQEQAQEQEHLPPEMSYLEELVVPEHIRLFDTEKEPYDVRQKRIENQKRMDIAIKVSTEAVTDAHAAAKQAVRSAASAVTVACVARESAIAQAQHAVAGACSALRHAHDTANQAWFEARKCLVKQVLVHKRVVELVLSESSVSVCSTCSAQQTTPPTNTILNGYE